MGRKDMAAQVYDLFVQICPVVFAVTLADTDRAKGILQISPRISARDAVHAAVMLNNEVATIATFDAGFDSLEEIKRARLS
jgi:predicted nucleic acid-binding protein